MASPRLSSSKRISVTELTIRKPTMISAGAVAHAGTTPTKGARIRAAINRIAVNSELETLALLM